MKNSLTSIVNHYKEINGFIEKALLEGRTEEAGYLIEKYNIQIDNSDIYSQKAIYFIQSGEKSKAIDTLEKGLIKHPFNYDINYNLGFLYNNKNGDYIYAIKYFIYAAKYAFTEKEQQEAIENIQEILFKAKRRNDPNYNNMILYFQEFKKILQEMDGRSYPLDKNGESLIRKSFKKNKNDEYLINMYKSSSIDDVNNNTRLFFKSELIKGQEMNCEKVLQIQSPAIIPISLIDPQTIVEFLLNDSSYLFKNNQLNHNKFHYINISEPGKVTIKSNKNIFVGKPILDVKKKIDKKLVLKIFIDGLSMKFLEKKGIDKLMPNTFKFFEKGFISKNCFGTSEWTLPCKASVNTGNYSTNHRLLHPNIKYSFENHNKLMAEYYSEAGYLTTNICTNWRTTPAFGYYKGFDRTIYQNFMGGMDCSNVVMETIEHLESFNYKNNFMSISMMDLHNVPDEIENHLMTEVNTDIAFRINSNKKGVTSVQTKYDETKIHKYELEIKRVDVFLGILFNYITKKYNDEDVVILLHSDHGQSFLEDEGNILHESRTKIPLMIKGKDIALESNNEFIEMIDILPIILNASGLNVPEDIDGCLPKIFGGNAERDYTITQVIHPQQAYMAIVRDSQHDFYFETKGLVTNDLTINIEDYDIRLLDKETKVEVSNLFKEKIQTYEMIIFYLIKDFIRWKK